MKVLELDGTPYDIGFKHGIDAKQEVECSLDSYEKLFYSDANITWRQSKELAKKHLNAIEKENVDLIEEMEGVAKGASVDFEDILALNARSEIVLTQNKADGCTSLAFLPPTSENSFLAQTWDWRSAQSQSLIATKIRQQDGTTIHMITEGGIIGKIGLNNFGLGVCLNALRANVKSEQLPVHLGLREVLNSKTFQEAQTKVTDNGRLGSSANFMIAQDTEKTQQAVNLEISPNMYDEKETAGSYLYHTNHFCSESLNKLIGKENINTAKNSYERFNRINELIHQFTLRNKTITENDIKMWLSDHKNEPNSICRHKELGQSDYTDTITAFAVIMNLTNKSMYLMEGQPCHPLKEFRLKL